MRLLVLLTLVVSAISFDPTTDIEIKFGGWCDHFLTIDECADPATLTAALAQPNLKHMEDDSRIINDPDKKLSIYSLKVNSGYQNFANRQGSRPFTIYDHNGDTMPAGCLLREEDSWSSTSSTYWGIHWGTMYSPLELAQYNARKAYVESEESDTDNKRIYYAYACHYQRPCICRKSGGLSAPDRSLPGTYYSKYEAAAGPQGEKGDKGDQGDKGTSPYVGEYKNGMKRLSTTRYCDNSRSLGNKIDGVTATRETCAAAVWNAAKPGGTGALCIINNDIKTSITSSGSCSGTNRKFYDFPGDGTGSVLVSKTIILFNRDSNLCSYCFSRETMTMPGSHQEPYELSDSTLPLITDGSIVTYGNSMYILKPGQDKSVEPGTDSNIWFELKGADGAQGPAGIQGIQGPAGVNGTQGVQGIQGIQGLKGDKGDKGDRGDAGASVQGPAGAQGPAGPQGPIGPQGPAGEASDIGDLGLGSIASLDELYLWIIAGGAGLALIIGIIALFIKGGSPVGNTGTDVENKPLLTQVRVERKLGNIDF